MSTNALQLATALGTAQNSLRHIIVKIRLNSKLDSFLIFPESLAAASVPNPHTITPIRLRQPKTPRKSCFQRSESKHDNRKLDRSSFFENRPVAQSPGRAPKQHANPLPGAATPAIY